MAIEFCLKTFTPLTVRDLKVGRAYVVVNPGWKSIVFISNPYQDIVAFSVCGNHLIFIDSTHEFREIDLEISATI